MSESTIAKYKVKTDIVYEGEYLRVEPGSAGAIVEIFKEISNILKKETITSKSSFGPFPSDTHYRITTFADPATVIKDIYNGSSESTSSLDLIGDQNGKYSIVAFGATGGSDDSAAVEKAAEYAATHGGTVYIPPGEWFFDNITVYDNVRYEGAGWRATTVKPVSGSSNSVFKYKGSGELQGGSFAHMYIYGNGLSSGHGIDLGSATIWIYSPGNTGLKIENCNIGINCSANDRRPYFSECYFWNNNIGVYTGGSHTQLDSCDFRGNVIGLSGDAMYDMQIENCSFVRNGHGIKPTDFSGGGSISQTTLTSCMFFGNYQGAAIVNKRVKFVNCHLISTTEGSTEVDSFGVYFADTDSGWYGGIVDAETGNGFGDYAFIIDCQENCTIEGVTYTINRFVRTDPVRSTYRRIKIDNNVGNVTHGRFAYMQSGANGFQGCSISNNHIGIIGVQADYVSDLTTGDGFLEVDLSHPDIGNKFIGNIFHANNDGILAYAYDVHASGSIVTQNICRKTAGFNLTATDVDTVDENNIFHAGS